jgi:hypothetical protein
MAERRIRTRIAVCVPSGWHRPRSFFANASNSRRRSSKGTAYLREKEEGRRYKPILVLSKTILEGDYLREKEGEW